MFKKIALLGLFLGLAGAANAWDFGFSSEKTVTARYTQSFTGELSTAAVVIDLSDTTNWPHSETDEIRVHKFWVTIDKAAASTTTVKLGVVTAVDSSSGSVTWFYGRPGVNNVSNTNVYDSVDSNPNWINCRVNPNNGGQDGDTPYLISNDKASDDTVYQSDVTLPTPNGTYVAPAIGDIVIYIANEGDNAATVSVDIQYQSE